MAVDARTSKRAEAEGRKLAMTVDAPPAAKPAEPAPASRGSQDRLATLDIEIPSKAEAPAPPRPSNASPLSALPSTPPPSNGKKLELDVHALRRHRRSSDPSRAPRTSDEPPLAARRWLRVAIASACAAIVLVLFVRFVVHPSGVLQAAAHALRSAASP